MTRYASGTSLLRTKKERALDDLESLVGDFDDETYIDMKKLKISTLNKLIKELCV